MWCGITRSFFLGPYFFEEVPDGDLQTCTVTNACYLDMLTYYAIPELQRQNALSEFVWMQDGDPPHVGFSVKRLLINSLVAELSPVISRFHIHQRLLISHQRISGYGDT